MADAVIDLGYRPRTWQAECHRKKARFTVLALHRRAGKTELAVLELLNAALKTTKQLSHFGYLAPFRNQAKAVAWARLKHYARQIPGCEVNESELWILFVQNGAKIQIFGADNADAMRGLRFDGVVIDEVANIKPEVWNEIVQPALSDRMGWALFIGTPHGVNLFSELFYKAQALPDWFSAVYTVYDIDALDPVEVERLKRDMPENEFRREMLCDFSAAAENQLISIAMAEEAARRVIREDQYNFSARVMGVDVARFGDDKSVIIRRQGLACFDPLVHAGLDNMAFAAHVARAIEDWKPDAVFIDIGNGSGVVDRLRQIGYPIQDINFGGKPIGPQYINKRTEMWWLMKEWIEAGGCIPNRPDLKQDLAAPTFSYNAANKICLESKDEIKKRIMRSTDISDALCLTFAYPVAPSMRHLHPAFGYQNAQALTEYDIFAENP